MTFAIRRYAAADHAAARDLFIRVNRELAPEALRAAFESYVVVSLRDEVDRLADYYAEKNGAFFVATDAGRLAGMFGLERLGTAAPSGAIISRSAFRSSILTYLSLAGARAFPLEGACTVLSV